MVRIQTILAVILMAGVFAQPAKSDAAVSESKQAAIREVLEIVGLVGMAEQMREQQSMLELMQIQPNYREMMQFAVSEHTELSDEDRQRLFDRFRDFDAFAERFHDLFVERLDFSTIIAVVDAGGGSGHRDGGAAPRDRLDPGDRHRGAQKAGRLSGGRGPSPARPRGAQRVDRPLRSSIFPRPFPNLARWALWRRSRVD
jgi:hypothetical protein